MKVKYVSKKENYAFLGLLCELGETLLQRPWAKKNSNFRAMGHNRSNTHKIDERISQLEQEISQKIFKAKKKNQEYPLHHLIKKMHLDEKEKQILSILLYKELHGDKETLVSQIASAISNGTYADMLANLDRYFAKSSTLVKEEIIWFAHTFCSKTCQFSVSGYQQIWGREENRASKCAIPLPKEIYHALSQTVIGQEEAKEAISVAAYCHCQFINNPVKTNFRGLKNNILLVGPTGVGKTSLIRALSKFLNVPMVICDATEYTETGYVGRCVSEIPIQLYHSAGNNKEVAEKGIVFIDEIDKIAERNRGSGQRDVSGRSVQEELLTLMEEYQEREFLEGRPFSERITLNMSKVLFVAAGAFDDGLKSIAGSRRKPKLGFQGTDETTEKGITTEDFIKYGLLPELVGRFPVIIELKPLTEEEFYRILIDPKDSLVKQYQEYFNNRGIDIEFNEDALRKISNLAYQKNIGARGLQSVMELLMRPLILNSQNNMGKKFIITSSFIEDILVA